MFLLIRLRSRCCVGGAWQCFLDVTFARALLSHNVIVSLHVKRSVQENAERNVTACCLHTTSATAIREATVVYFICTAIRLFSGRKLRVL